MRRRAATLLAWGLCAALIAWQHRCRVPTTSAGAFGDAMQADPLRGGPRCALKHCLAC